MASSSGTNYARRFFWLAVAIAVAIAAYTAGWYYAAGVLEREVRTAVAGLNRDGRRANCENAEARGYPFRIGVFCRSVHYAAPGDGIAIRANALRSAAQVYNPYHVVAELDGPAAVELPGINALDLGWTSLRASVRIAEPVPERVSVEARELDIALDAASGGGARVATVEQAEFHLRPNGTDLDLAARWTGLRADPELVGGVVLPPVAGLVDVAVEGWAAGPASSLRGQSGTLRTASIRLDEDTSLALSGPFSVGDDGLVDARLEVTLSNPGRIASVLGDLLPEQRSEIQLAAQALGSMGGAASLPLTIDKGEMSLGFLPLGNLPPF